MSKYNVAVVGVGMVGSEMLRILHEREFPINALKVLATRERDEEIHGRTYHVEPTTEDSFNGVQIALFAGTEGAKAGVGGTVYSCQKALL